MFQETKELTITSAPRTGEWHNLAEAIREGSRRLPIQCFGVMYLYDAHHTPIAACAIGAIDYSDMNYGTMDVEIPCPACGKVGAECHLTLLAHLNDDHRWTRERIADWLDTL